MQRRAGILAGVLAVTGAIFVGQGLGLLRGSSFMVGDPRWAVIGAILFGAAIVVAWRATRHGRAG